MIVLLCVVHIADSGVYMESEDVRQEYVLNETGMIWAGTNTNRHIWHWNFAQVTFIVSNLVHTS